MERKSCSHEHPSEGARSSEIEGFVFVEMRGDCLWQQAWLGAFGQGHLDSMRCCTGWVRAVDFASEVLVARVIVWCPLAVGRGLEAEIVVWPEDCWARVE